MEVCVLSHWCASGEVRPRKELYMSKPSDFGREIGLLHEVIVAGRGLGIGREWWKCLKDPTVLREAISLLSVRPVLSVPILSGRFDELVLRGNYSSIDAPFAAWNQTHKGLSWRLEPLIREEVPCSLVFIPGGCSQDQILRLMDRSQLRPANNLETLSFGAALSGHWKKKAGRDDSVVIPIEEGVSTDIVSLDAKPLGPGPHRERMMIQASYRDRESLGLAVFSLNEDWEWEPKYGVTMFLAVPSD